MQKTLFHILALLTVLFLLLGCNTLTPPLQPQIKIDPPDILMLPCRPLPLLAANARMNDLIQHDIALIQIYGECQLQINSLQEWINKNPF